MEGENDEEDCEGDFEWHYRYNRRLSCFSHSVSCITFSMDGQFLVSGTGSGDVKVWDTGSWAEAARLKGLKREEPRALVISPAQRWLVAAYGSVLHIFKCSAPWKLEQSLPTIVDPCTKETSEWSCVAFSPMAEVDHPGGHTGQDNHLAAFSTAHLCVLDYSQGWGSEVMARKTRSLMQSARPTSLAYTACGWWMICGFESGQLQIWNAFSLTLEKSLCAHADTINSLAASPRAARYESRLVSCGVDQALRVWHSNGWLLEQHLHDTRCDRAGVRRCAFSCSGNWFCSVASELSIWRVCITRRNRMVLQLHQRLAAICGAEGLRTAAFCSHNDAIAVGSRDGVLGLWTKYAGAPTDPVESSDASSTAKRGSDGDGSRTYGVDNKDLPRPMQRITPQGVKPLLKPAQPRGEWFQRANFRSMTMMPLGSRGRTPLGSTLSTAASAGRLSLAAPSNSRPGTPCGTEEALTKKNSMPDFRWRAPSFELEGVLSQMGSQTARLEKHMGSAVPDGLGLTPSDSCRASTPMGGSMGAMRKSMLHSLRGGCQVQRVSLDPKVITDHLDKMAEQAAAAS